MQRLVQEAEEDHAQQRGDRELEAAEAAALQREDHERDHAGHQPRGEQRHAEQQVEPQRGADELGDVGRHRHHLGLHPHAPRKRPGVGGAEQLGEVVVGDHPELGRQVLDQHRHHVGDQHDPQQQVAELRAALDVGGEVAGVHVGDGGDERGAEHRQRGAHAPARQQLLERARAEFERRGRRLRDGLRAHAAAPSRSPSSSTRIACASWPPIGCSLPVEAHEQRPPERLAVAHREAIAGGDAAL